MYGSGIKARAKTAKFAFPSLVASDGQELFSSTLTSTMNQDVFTQAQKYSFVQKGYSTLPIPMPKGKSRAGTATTLSSTIPLGSSLSMSTLFPYPPIPTQNPKLKLLKNAGIGPSTPGPARKLNYTGQAMTLAKSKLLQPLPPPAVNPTPTSTSTTTLGDNKNVLKTTITIPILPHKPKSNSKKNAKVKSSNQTKTKVLKSTEKSIVADGPTISGETEANAGAIDGLISPLSPLIGARFNELDKAKEKNHNPERMRVSRTEKEREASPDCIRVEKLGLKQFPIIGSEECNLRVLSLQHNSISRLDNLPALTHLLVLDLYDNRVERITGLHGFTSLKVLLLGKNRIRRIEGLDGLKRLEILDLHGNQLRYVDNLAALSSLRVLNLAGNLIRTIRNLGPYGLSSLTELNLKRNRIKNLEGLQKAPHIKKLFLANNDLHSMSALHPLRKLLFLQELLLESNPLCSLLDYTSQILTFFPFLETLDRTSVSEQMKNDAKIWQSRRLAIEEERRKELEKLHATLGSSRDEVIFEAKRRWESVKHFVRSKSEQDSALVYQGVTNVSEPLNKAESHVVIEPAEESQMAENVIDDFLENGDIVEPRLSRTSIKNLSKVHNLVTNNNSTVVQKSKLADISNELDLSEQGFNNADEIVDKTHDETKYPADIDDADDNDSSQDIPSPEAIDTDTIATELSKPSQGLPILPRPTAKLTKVAVVRPLLRSKTVEREHRPIETSQFNHPTSYSSLSAGNYIAIPTPLSARISEEVSSESEHTTVAQLGKLNNDQLNLCKADELSKDSETVGLVLDQNIVSYEPSSNREVESKPTPALLQRDPPEESHKSQRSTPTNMLRRSSPSYQLPEITSDNGEHLDLISSEMTSLKPSLKNWRSASVDVQFPSGESDTSEAESVATSTNTSDISSRKQTRRQSTRLKWRVKTARQSTVTNSFGRRPSTCARERERGSGPIPGNKSLRRVDSGLNLDAIAPSVLKRQGSDYLVEIEGKVLSIYGQGALKHTLPGFPSSSTTSNVTTVHFHFISYDAIIPYFGKLKQFYPTLDNFHFRSNNISTLGQLNALSDLQGIVSLQISSDGNLLVEYPFWKEYAVYRLGHWGLQFVNGKEIVSEYRGNGGNGRINSDLDYKMFDSLGYLALSCLPQTALKPLAKRLHTLHCFCCCSPSSSSDESGKKKTDANGESNGNVCNAWDDDPVLLDVIGKEALVYTQPDPGRSPSKSSQEIAVKIINSGQLMLEKLEMLEKVWPSMMCEAIQDILTDYMFMDSYMKKELKKLNAEVLANEKLK